MAEAEPLSNLPELVPAAVFMEDVNSFMQGDDMRRAHTGGGPGHCHRRRRCRRSCCRCQPSAATTFHCPFSALQDAPPRRC